LALLFAASVALDFSAERAMRRDYERAGLEQLKAIAGVGLARVPVLSAVPPVNEQEISGLQAWTRELAASGVRVTVITEQGLVLADSQSDPQSMENHADRPEVLDALATGSGHSSRHSATLNRDLLYYAVRQQTASGRPIVIRFSSPLEMV